MKILTATTKKATARLDESAVVEAIGESLTHKTPNLEELSGPMRSTTLQKWVPRLTRLRSLAPFHGSSLENTGALLAAHCPTFGWLRFFSWNADDADEIFAKFLTDLHSQSLRSLEIYSLAQLHTKAFTALNNHSASLVELKLGTLESHAIRCLPLLNHCTQLRTLSFSERYQKSVEWEKDHPELIRGLTGWINNCKHLRSLSVTRFGPSLVPILRNEDIRLDHLEVLGYPLADSDDFHIAVGNQANLRSLTLKADTTGSYEERLDTHQSLASSMTQLKDLTYLDLRSSSDAFRDEDVISIAKTHPKLETWWTGGTFITDQVLKPIASMRQLKRLECSAITRFSRKGLEDFFNNLQLPGNDRFNFAVSAPDESEEYDISAEDEEYIKSIAQSRVNGNIEFPGRFQSLVLPARTSRLIFHQLVGMVLPPDLMHHSLIQISYRRKGIVIRNTRWGQARL